MERLFKKSFKFKVDRYEEWANGVCTSQGHLSGEIVATILGNLIAFQLFGMEHLSIRQTLVFSLTHPYTQILRAKWDPLVASDRIQYFGVVSSDDTVPHLCHLFCEGDHIQYVRFDFSPLFPVAGRLYEFYGRQC